MKQMYDVVYDEFVDTGIAKELEEPIIVQKKRGTRSMRAMHTVSFKISKLPKNTCLRLPTR